MEFVLDLRENCHELVDCLRCFDEPTLGAINEPAVVGDHRMALRCDLRIVSDRGRLRDTSLRYDLIPDEGGVCLFPMCVGLENALKISVLSKWIVPRTGYVWGWSRQLSTTTVSWTGPRNWLYS
jgi:2-(1,2-epoxy-1,2-dihydrophenyl)acetyl-CoA isomerase